MSSSISDRFPTSSKSFQKFDKKNFWQGCHNCILRVRMKIFFVFWQEKGKKSFFSEKLHCYHFQTLIEKDSMYFCRHGYGRRVKTSLYMFRRRIWQIGFLESSSIFHNFSNSRKFFKILTWNFRQGGHNWILHVQWKFLRKYIFLSKSSFFSSFSESELQICGFLQKKFR